MSTREKVCSLLDQPTVLRTDLVDQITYVAPITPEPIIDTGDAFRDFLASIRLEQSSRGRCAHRVLLIGHGAKPCRQGVRELLRLRLDWMPAAWCTLYKRFSGTAIAVAALMSNEPEPRAPREIIPMPPGKKFVGIARTNAGTWLVRIKLADGKRKYIGTWSDPSVAAAEFDKAARATPLKSGRQRKLNFMIDDPLACTPEPRVRRAA